MLPQLATVSPRRPARRENVPCGDQGISTSVPASVISILPVHWQLHEESSVNALLPDTSTTEDPGDQAAVTTGMHGIGVSTPWAAAVAVATWGLACVLHMPNAAMFTIGA